ncbi:MAG: T9SS type A sorting domain-containing protein [Flavobacteriales bacterium]|nr:T9SS type A sorting domain-containing protein [Flavobacteriales bacterium]
MMFRKYYILILSLFFIEEAFAQINLVPNHSFEGYTSCPSTVSQLPLAVPWAAPRDNSVEYLNACSTNPYYSVPNQVLNFQEAHSGNAFIGMFLYNGPNANIREYAQVQLLNSLTSNQCYYVEFFTNRATGSFGGKYAVNNIGCSFTDTASDTTAIIGSVLNLTPHVLEFNNSIITDTINWVKISGIYTAVGGEQYITIGNFFDDANTDTLNMLDGTYKGAVYFFDDVSVIPVDSIPSGMSAYAGVDTNITLGDSVFIGQQISNLNCNWYNAGGSLIASGTSGIFVNPTVNTFYVVEQNLCGTITYDTVTVTVLPTNINELFKENNVRIYPNPSTGDVWINLDNNLTVQSNVIIYDIAGKIVFEQNILIGNHTKISPDLHGGTYFISIQPNNNTIKPFNGKVMFIE